MNKPLLIGLGVGIPLLGVAAYFATRKPKAPVVAPAAAASLGLQASVPAVDPTLQSVASPFFAPASAKLNWGNTSAPEAPPPPVPRTVSMAIPMNTAAAAASQQKQQAGAALMAQANTLIAQGTQTGNVGLIASGHALQAQAQGLLNS